MQCVKRSRRTAMLRFSHPFFACGVSGLIVPPPNASGCDAEWRTITPRGVGWIYCETCTITCTNARIADLSHCKNCRSEGLTVSFKVFFAGCASPVQESRIPSKHHKITLCRLWRLIPSWSSFQIETDRNTQKTSPTKLENPCSIR